MPDPIGAAAIAAQSTREDFLKSWGKMLGCPTDAFEIVCRLINESKNFQTASAVLFGLSFRTHSEYINGCATYWRKIWTPEDICTVDWLVAFQKHYVEEVKPYPSDA